MNSGKVVGLILIVAGVLALAYGGFTYTKDSHEARIGPIKLSVKDTETVNIPIWLGAVSIIAGVLLVVVRGKN